MCEYEEEEKCRGMKCREEELKFGTSLFTYRNMKKKGDAFEWRTIWIHSGLTITMITVALTMTMT